MMAPLGPVEEIVGKDSPLNSSSSLKKDKHQMNSEEKCRQPHLRSEFL